MLPARFPNLLVNGTTGIAVGMATNIPPHNLSEVVGAVKAYIENPEIDLAGLMKHVKGPDFPGGGMMSAEGIRDAYASGRGSVRVRARAHIEPLRGGKEAVIVSELPFMVKKGGDGGLITKIADLVREKKINGISDLRDESDRSGMRLVIELKRGGDPHEVVLNQLFKHTQMQASFGLNMVALVDGVPRTLSLKELIHHYVGHQREVVTRRTQYELRRAEARAHILEGLLIALDNLDAVIELIRSSADTDAARAGLIEKFELSEEQAQAILDMRLARLTALESDKVRSEHAELIERIAALRAILGDPARIDGVVVEELDELEERYGDERRTEITHFEGDMNIEDMIADQQMVISITRSGYVKRLPLATYRQQRRGGIGVMGMDLKEGDYIEHLHICSTHDWMLFFTNRGKVYRLKVYELPEGSRTSKGRALVNVLPLRDRERVMAVKPDPRLQRGQVPGLRDRQGTGQEDRVPRLQHAHPGRRDHRDQGPRRRRAGAGASDLRRRRPAAGLEVGPRLALFREGGAPDGPRHLGRQGDERRRQDRPRGQPRAGHGRRPRRRRALRGHGERLWQAHGDPGVPGQGARHQGRADGEADAEEGRAGRRADRPRAPGPAVHLGERHGATHPGRRHLADGPRHPGRPGDEPPRRRSGQRRRAGGRVRRRGRGGRGFRGWGQRSVRGRRRGRGPAQPEPKASKADGKPARKRSPRKKS